MWQLKISIYDERAAGKSHEEVMPIIWKNGRDNSRTPMQWNAEQNGGFTMGIPWMKINPNYEEVNAEAGLQDKYSILNYYKNLICLREGNDILIYGSYQQILAEHESIFAYQRT